MKSLFKIQEEKTVSVDSLVVNDEALKQISVDLLNGSYSVGETSIKSSSPAVMEVYSFGQTIEIGCSRKTEEKISLSLASGYKITIKKEDE